MVDTLAAGVSHGARASVVAALGCTLGIVPHMLASLTGVTALFHTSAVAFQGLKALGVVYLLDLAWATFREQGALAVEADIVRRSPARVVLSGVLVNVLNPKPTIFFLAFLLQLVGRAEPGPTRRLLDLSAVFMVVTFVVFSAYGVLAAAVRSRIVSRPRVMTWLRRSFAGSFVGLSAKLATTSR